MGNYQTTKDVPISKFLLDALETLTPSNRYADVTIDITDQPTAPILDELDFGYPVRGLNVHGECLTGWSRSGILKGERIA